MYFANNKGLLEFDGSEWNTYSIHNAKLRAVKIGNDGRIYVGGLGQFGYFIPNKRGELSYVCLSDSIDRHKVTNIWNIHIVDNRVYFQGDFSVFYLENDRLTKVDCPWGLSFSEVINNKFYVASSNGLLVLNGNEFVRLPGTEIATKSRVVGLFPYNGKIIIVTSLNGLFLYDGKTVLSFPTSADPFMEKNQLFCAALHRSLLVLGSVQDGAMLLNLRKDQTEKISIDNGLQNKSVLSADFDREGNLWLGLDNGIDYISLNSRLFFLYSQKSVIGAGYSSCCYRRKLYLGTNQGLYETDIPGNLNEDLSVKFISGTDGQVLSLFQYDGKLFCGGRNFFIMIDGDKIFRFKQRGVWNVSILGADPNVLLVSTYWGLYILRKKDNAWYFANKVRGGEFSAKTMYVEEGTNNVWIANKENGLFRLTISDDLQSVIRKKCFSTKLLHAGDNMYVTKINNNVVIASREGLFRYNQIKDCLEEYKDLEKLFNGKGVYTYLMEDKFKNIWYVNNGMLKLLRFDPDKKKYFRNESESYLSDYMIQDFENISLCGDDQAIIGTEDGFALMRFKKKLNERYPLTLQIRKVYSSEKRDSLIYGRSYLYDNNPLIIPYRRNSIKIKYSASNYEQFQTVFYSYKLSINGQKAFWSEYGKSNLKEYTDLHEGEYTFFVKVVTDKDKKPVIASFSFIVLPPWYRSWWAYILYLVLFFSLMSYAYYKMVEKKKKLIRQKEEELIRQKVIFKNESELKDRTIDSLKEENLLSELKYKSEELVRNTLNLVRKNEMLQSIRKEAIGINHSISEENLVNIRRRTLRLIGRIDVNIEHDDDLKAFQTTFDFVHRNFFKRLDELFPELNSKEKMLCAYIKMNLMSKEIAPLLNISVRGVEISRYRLRKKLNLNEKENLADFLQKLSD